VVAAVDRGVPQVRDVPPLASLTRGAPRPAWWPASRVALVLAGAVGRDGWHGAPARSTAHCGWDVQNQGRFWVGAYEIEPLGP
jgi:hypothetical protein